MPLKQILKRKSTLINKPKSNNKTYTYNNNEIIPRRIYQIWIKQEPNSIIPKNVMEYVSNAKSWCNSNGYDHVFIDENSDIYKECVENSNFCQYQLENKRNAYACAVSDYLRLYIIHKFGGIYVDCDVIIKNGFDLFLHNDFFISLETPLHPPAFIPYHNNFPRFDVGIIGSSKNNNTPQIIMDYLDNVFYDAYFDDVDMLEFLKNKYAIRNNIHNVWSAIPDLIPFIIQEIENKKIIKITQTYRPKTLTINNDIFEVYNERFFSNNGIYTQHDFIGTWWR